jgi:hypothetical protein
MIKNKRRKKVKKKRRRRRRRRGEKRCGTNPTTTVTKVQLNT